MKYRVVKIGGNVIDNPLQLNNFLDSLSASSTNEYKTILVHGGGKIATELSKQLGLQTTMIEGRRVTDEATLRIVVMVYAGLINKNITAQLNARGIKAIGICGADAQLLLAQKREHPEYDFGFVGDIKQVDIQLLELLLDSNIIPVLAPITADSIGQLLNTNADTIASSMASALAASGKKVELLYFFEKDGVLLDIHNPESLIMKLEYSMMQKLQHTGAIASGMIPKLNNGFNALRNGVQKVLIANSAHSSLILQGELAGTSLILE